MTAMFETHASTDQYADILEHFSVPEDLHQDFAVFIETGEASPPFRDFVNSNRDCQQAVERAFARRIERMREVVDALKDQASREQGEEAGEK